MKDNLISVAGHLENYRGISPLTQHAKCFQELCVECFLNPDVSLQVFTILEGTWAEQATTVQYDRCSSQSKPGCSGKHPRGLISDLGASRGLLEEEKARLGS